SNSRTILESDGECISSDNDDPTLLFLEYDELSNHSVDFRRKTIKDLKKIKDIGFSKNTNLKINNIWSDVIMDQNLISQMDTVAFVNGIKRSKNLGPECYYTSPDIMPIINNAYKNRNKIKKLNHNYSNKDDYNDKIKFNCKNNIFRANINDNISKGDTIDTNLKCNINEKKNHYKHNKYNKGIENYEEIIKKFGDQTLGQRRKHVVYRLNAYSIKSGYERFYKNIGFSHDTDSKTAVTIISKYLEESNIDLIEKIVNNLGALKTCQILCETDAIQKMGGLYTLDGKRKRTFGGVFIVMVKTDLTVDQSLKALIFGNENQPKINIAKDKKDIILDTEKQLDKMNSNEPSDSKGNSVDHIDLEIKNTVAPPTHPIPISPAIMNDDINENIISGSSNDLNVKRDSEKIVSKPQNTKKNKGIRKLPPLPVEIRQDNKFLYYQSPKNRFNRNNYNNNFSPKRKNFKKGGKNPNKGIPNMNGLGGSREQNLDADDIDVIINKEIDQLSRPNDLNQAANSNDNKCKVKKDLEVKKIIYEVNMET
ncbi:unnamed protein product, partial [Gordionus sp. m RMFG-2023]